MTPNGPVILENIPFDIDNEVLEQRLHLEGHHRFRGELTQLIEQARPLAQPRAMFRMAFVQARGDDWVIVDGMRLESRILRVNLEAVHRLFPYVATCGSELADWARSLDGGLQHFLAAAICEAALYLAFRSLKEHIADRYDTGDLSFMSPGSLPDWPLDQQRPLFSLLGDPRAAMGVTLTDSFLMTPLKSVSGVFFATRAGFESCQLCPRDACPGRRAPYDEHLLQTKYQGARKSHFTRPRSSTTQVQRRSTRPRPPGINADVAQLCRLVLVHAPERLLGIPLPGELIAGPNNHCFRLSGNASVLQPQLRRNPGTRLRSLDHPAGQTDRLARRSRQAVLDLQSQRHHEQAIIAIQQQSPASRLIQQGRHNASVHYSRISIKVLGNSQRRPYFLRLDVVVPGCSKAHVILASAHEAGTRAALPFHDAFTSPRTSSGQPPRAGRTSRRCTVAVRR